MKLEVLLLFTETSIAAVATLSSLAFPAASLFPLPSPPSPPHPSPPHPSPPLHPVLIQG